MRPDYVETVIEESRRVDFDVELPPQTRLDAYRPVLITVVRDEMAALPGFLEHYRRRGIREFVFLDNGSTDGSQAFLRQQDDVCLVEVRRPFRWEFKQGWITRVIETIGHHRWFLVVDADERVVYPGDHRYSFSDLALEMELVGHWRIRGVLVDLYGEAPLLHPAPGEITATQTLFDGDGYHETRTWQMMSVKGGPRPRVLSMPGLELNPELTKYPLFRLAAGETMANPHHHWPFEENFKSPCRLGILHYKFGPGLAAKMRTAIAEKSYWNDSVEYRAYHAALQANPELSLEYPGSRRYRSPADLVDAGLVEAFDWREHWWARFRIKWRQRLGELARGGRGPGA